MQEHEGWLTHLSPGVVSQLEIPLANHLQYKRKVKAVKTLTYILRIRIDRQVKKMGNATALNLGW